MDSTGRSGVLTPSAIPDDLAAELARALDMLLNLATDKRVTLPTSELYTNMALNGARVALDKAKAAGLLPDEG